MARTQWIGSWKSCGNYKYFDGEIWFAHGDILSFLLKTMAYPHCIINFMTFMEIASNHLM